MGVRCARPDAAGICLHGGTLHSAIAVIYSATVTIDDPKPPTVKALSGSLTSGGWLRGTRSVTVTGSDETGIDLSGVRRNGVAVLSDDRACDFTRPAPCASPGQEVVRTWNVDTSGWPDGTHTVTGVVTDAGGTQSVTSALSVKVDNTPPQAPTGLKSDSGDGWSNAATRQLSWSLPADSGSPIASASVKVCSVLGQCSTQAADSTSGATVALPADGTYTATVQLTDEAGNTSVANTASTTLRLDRTPPPAPGLGEAATDPDTRELTLPVGFSDDPGPAPIVACAGELCRSDGTGCQPLPAQQRVSELRFSPPADGTWLVRAWVIDAAGNVGAAGTRSVTRTTPVPTATPGDGQPGVEPTPTPTVTPGVEQPAPAREPVALRVQTLRLGRATLRLVVRLPPDARGRLTVTFRRNGRRTVRRPRPRNGRVALRLAARGARTGTVAIRYAGDAAYAPTMITKRVRR